MLALLQRTRFVSRWTYIVRPDLDCLCIWCRKRPIDKHKLPPLLCLLSVLGIVILCVLK